MNSSPISSITTGPRQSNFELLRLLLMLMVLCIHASYPAGIPDSFSSPHDIFGTAVEALTICAVNCFVMISGWFSIKTSARGFLNFIFQCLYFAVICSFFCLFYNGTVKPSNFTSLLFVGYYGHHWFVVTYMGLYLFAPLLNRFAEKATRTQLLSFVVLFLIFQLLYGWIVDGTSASGGFSAFSFFGLYLLARYFRLHYKNGTTWKKPFLLYLLSSSIIFACFPLLEFEMSFKYTNPFIILSALSLLLCFSRINIKPNRTINRLATSAFGVYLLHHGIGTYTFYRSLFREGSPIFQYSGITYIALTLGIILLWYAAGIILDQPRRWLWKRFGDKITCFTTDCWNKFISRLSTTIS